MRRPRSGYKRRLTELQTTIAGYEAAGETARAAAAIDQRAWLIAELAAAAGLGGRTRQFATGAERARVAVGKAIRRVLEATDARALDAAVGAWLDARLRASGQAAGHARRPWRAVKVDGKAVRGTRHASGDGQPVHLLAALDQRCGVVLGQVGVEGETNEIIRFAPLLEPLDLAGCVITADALHAQHEHAEALEVAVLLCRTFTA